MNLPSGSRPRAAREEPVSRGRPRPRLQPPWDSRTEGAGGQLGGDRRPAAAPAWTLPRSPSPQSTPTPREAKGYQERSMGQEPPGPQGLLTPGRGLLNASVWHHSRGKSSVPGRPVEVPLEQSGLNPGAAQRRAGSSWRAGVWEERGRGSASWEDTEAGAWRWAPGSPRPSKHLAVQPEVTR